MSAREPVLVVDDSAPLRDMVVTLLRPRGHRVLTAADGREALALLHEASEPYVVLLDIVMPGLDGPGVCAAIQMNPPLRDMGHKIILMSSTVRLSAPDLPPSDGQLVKPFTRLELLAALDAVRQHV